MRLYAPLLLTLLAVGARAASIPDKILPELEKKLVSEEVPPVENVSSEPELVDPANTVIDVENNLRNNVKPEDIPVQVIVEETQPVLKTEIKPLNEVSEEEEIKRPLADLRNPGPPQHQEHETQNPEHYEDVQRTVSTVKEDIQEAQVILRQSFQGVTNGIQNWYTNNEQISNIQNSMHSLQENFAAQVQKLNETIQNFLNPDNSNPISITEGEETKKKLEQIETHLKTLESNFNSGVKDFSEGVQVVASLKEEVASDSSSTSSPTISPPASFPNPIEYLLSMLGNLQTSVTSSFNNMNQAVSNFFTQNQQNFPLLNLPNILQQSTSSGPLSDAAVDSSTTTTTRRPSAWQNIQTSINNLFNPNQASQTVQNDAATQAPTGTFSVPTFPIITGLVNLIQRPSAQTTVKPAEAPQASAVPAGTNEFPPPVKPEEIKPDVEKIPEPAIKGINVAAQRIQEISDSEKPKDVAEETPVKAEDAKVEPEKNDDVKSEDKKVEVIKEELGKEEEAKVELERVDEVKEEAEKDEAGQEKGGYYGNRPGNPGDNNDGGERVIPQKEEQKIAIVGEVKEEVKETEDVPDKTE